MQSYDVSPGDDILAVDHNYLRADLGAVYPKAEADAFGDVTAGEIFEDTDAGDILAWKATNGNVYPVMITGNIDTFADDASGSDNAGNGGGAYDNSGNTDIDVSPFSSSDKLLIFYKIKAHVDTWPNPGTHSYGSRLAKVRCMQDLGDNEGENIGYDNSATDPGPYGGTESQSADSSVDGLTVSSVSGGNSGIVTISAPVWSGSSLRFHWHHSGTLGGTAASYSTWNIYVFIVKLAS